MIEILTMILEVLCIIAFTLVIGFILISIYDKWGNRR